MKQMAFLGFCVLVLASTAFSQKKATTLIGEVVDIKNYMMYGMKADNPDRKAAVESSITAGNPLGFLHTKTGKIYMVVMPQQEENANAKLKEYLGLRVYVKGVVYQKGKIQMIVLNDIGKSVK
jgi:hypothetical protein